MKRVVAIILSIISCLWLFTGCNKGWYADEHEFLYEKMSEIPIEYEGYCLGKSNSDPVKMEQGGEYMLNGVKLNVTYKGDLGFVINYKEREVIVDSIFMQEKSKVYNDINKIWDEKLEANNVKEKIENKSVVVFNDKVFIITMGLREHLSASVKGETPYCLYYYDIELDKVYYCGFYSGDFAEKGFYSGFREVGGLLQIKEEDVC